MPFAEAQSTSDLPDWAVAGTEFVYGWQLWEYFPTANVSSTISHMEQQFNVGTGNYTPKMMWDSLFKFSLVSADNQQGIFQVQGGHITFTGYEWDGGTAIWNYVWGNQTWLSNGTQISASASLMSIYATPAQLSAYPLVNVGNCQAYKVYEIDSWTNRTLYKYFQKDTGRLLFSLSLEIGQTYTDFVVFGLSTTSMQVIQIGENQSLSVMSNSTISAIAYNSTSNTLTFSATGPNGTKGYAEVTISKELCTDIDDMKVYVDEEETEFQHTSVDYDIGGSIVSYWIVTVTYQHSTHDIEIQVPEFSSFLLLACTLSIVATLGSAQLKQRKLTPG